MAATLNLPDIEKGATYRHTLFWKDKAKLPIDLTGATARMQIRDAIDSATVLLELSTAINTIIITPLEGKIELYIHSNQTTVLAGEGGVYDLELYLSNGDTVRLIQGEIAFSPEVTR